MVYNYTKPRGPIAAMVTGPGPCYRLPTLLGQEGHDPRYTRNPAFPFGQSYSAPAGSTGPGPCYYPDSRICRTGKEGSPRYSIYSRQKELEPYQTPGPGSYIKQTGHWITHHSAPAHTFGYSFPVRSNGSTPGPNVYFIPTVLGKTVQSDKLQLPSYSIYGRSKVGNFYDDLSKTPGPCAYQLVDTEAFKSKAPRCTMKGRNPMPGDTTMKPGPGAHSPEKVSIHKPKQPSYSMGIRHSEYTLPLIKTEN